MLKENPGITLTEDQEPEPRPTADEIMAGAPIQLWGSPCAFCERLDDEYFKSMQSIDPHTKAGHCTDFLTIHGALTPPRSKSFVVV